MITTYLILNHRPAPQLARLAGAIRSQRPDSPIVVHHDRFASRLDHDQLRGIDYLHVRGSRRALQWGDFSVVSAYWRTLRWVLDNIETDWIVTVSGQHYPIRPLDQLERMLATTPQDAFVQGVRVSDMADPAERRRIEARYLYQYVPLPTLGVPATGRRRLRRPKVFLAERANQLQPLVQVRPYPDPLPFRLGLRAQATPFSSSFPCWYGSTWTTVNRRAARALLGYLDAHPEFSRYYSRTPCPSESATCTLLCNDPSLNVAKRSFLYETWSQSGTGHPDVLRSADLPAMLESERFFGRKFDMSVDSSVLDELDALNSPAGAGIAAAAKHR